MSHRFRACLGVAAAGVLALTSCAPTAEIGADLIRGQVAEPPCGPNGCVLLEVTDDAGLAVPPPSGVTPPAGLLPTTAPASRAALAASVPTTTPAPEPPPVVDTTPITEVPTTFPGYSSDPSFVQGDSGNSDSGSSGSLTEGGTVTGESTVSAAQVQGWGQPRFVDNFDRGLGGWNLYNGPGHAGKGIRSPEQATTSGGILRISGDAAGKTEGMAWKFGARYGRWEGRMRAPVSDPSYNALMLLWPDAENFPVGGEIDFVEMLDHNRRNVDLFLHYGASNSQLDGNVTIDATQWHNWAVEWTPTAVTAFVDGRPWWRTTDTSILPPGPMHLCLQLDWFPQGGSVQPSEMFVDWVAFYPYTGAGTSETIVSDSGSTATSSPTTTTSPAVTSTQQSTSTTTSTTQTATTAATSSAAAGSTDPTTTTTEEAHVTEMAPTTPVVHAP